MAATGAGLADAALELACKNMETQKASFRKPPSSCMGPYRSLKAQEQATMVIQGLPNLDALAYKADAPLLRRLLHC